MRQYIFWFVLFIAMGIALSIGADSTGVWVGTQFKQSQCLEIKAGDYTVKRKLCTIVYEIRKKEGGFVVNGRLRFDKTFIPDKVSEVELEILLIDKKWVCSKQLDLQTTVEANQARFSFETENLPSQRYVRTYYVIHYRQESRSDDLKHTFSKIFLYTIYGTKNGTTLI